MFDLLTNAKATNAITFYTSFISTHLTINYLARMKNSNIPPTILTGSSSHSQLHIESIVTVTVPNPPTRISKLKKIVHDCY